MPLKHELQGVVSGYGFVTCGEPIQSILNQLRAKKITIQGSEKEGLTKKQEEETLITLINQNNFWFINIDPSKYIGEGAEQQIFEFSDPDFLIKLNDSIFYEYWEDYLVSLLLHNYFFPKLAYDLIGFYQKDRLYAVVKQRFVVANQITNLSNVKELLASNGFINRKANDYYNPDLGIILEDLHDENVLTNSGYLYFIDTVFYVTPDFYKD